MKLYSQDYHMFLLKKYICREFRNSNLSSVTIHMAELAFLDMIYECNSIEQFDTLKIDNEIAAKLMIVNWIAEVIVYTKNYQDQLNLIQKFFGRKVLSELILQTNELKEFAETLMLSRNLSPYLNKETINIFQK